MPAIRSMLALLLLALLPGLGLAIEPAKLTLGVVPSLGPAMQTLNRAFAEAHPDIAIDLRIATAPALGKDTETPPALLLLDSRAAADALVDAGRADGNSLRVLGDGLLAIYSNTEGVNTQRGAPLFIADYITGIALGDPAASPFGAQARAVMERLTVLDTAQSKFRLYPDDAAAADAVRAREVDIGVLPVTLLVTDAYAKTGSTTALPLGLYTPPSYVAVLGMAGAESVAARAYLDFLTAAETRPLLTEVGIAVPDAP